MFRNYLDNKTTAFANKEVRISTLKNDKIIHEKIVGAALKILYTADNKISAGPLHSRGKREMSEKWKSMGKQTCRFRRLRRELWDYAPRINILMEVSSERHHGSFDFKITLQFRTGHESSSNNKKKTQKTLIAERCKKKYPQRAQAKEIALKINIKTSL